MDFGKLKDQQLTGKDAQEFLDLPKKLRNDLRWHKHDANNYYEMPDGKIIAALVLTEEDARERGMLEGENGWKPTLNFPKVMIDSVYASEGELLAFVRKFEEARRDDPFEHNEHVLKNIVKDSAAFPDNLQSWIGSIANRLKLPETKLDASLESLSLIDKEIKEQKIPIADFYKTLLIPVFGYTGEVIRNYWNGEWFMQPSRQDKAIFEPLIRLPDGRFANYFLSFVDMVIEHYAGFSSYSVADLYTEFFGQEFPHARQN